MKYRFINNEEQSEYEIDFVSKNEYQFSFRDPKYNNILTSIILIDDRWIKIIRHSDPLIELNLKKNVIIKHNYPIEKYHLTIHTKCIEITKTDFCLSFKYLIYINHKKENQISLHFEW